MKRKSSIKDEFPKWKDTEPDKREISFEAAIELDPTRDIGFHQFVTKQLSLQTTNQPLRLSIAVTYRPEKPESIVVVKAQGKQYDDLNAQEVLKKLQSSRSIIFHNSTEIETRYMYPGRSVAGHIREITGQHQTLVESMKKTGRVVRMGWRFHRTASRRRRVARPPAALGEARRPGAKR
jgi:hypothetical protein